MVSIQALSRASMPAFQRLRQHALRDHPDAFGESSEEFSTVTLARLEGALDKRDHAGGCSLGAFSTDEQLVGMVNLDIGDSEKSKHRGILWGMYVAPQARGQGVGHRLVAALLEHARQQAEVLQIHLGVVTTNAPAIRLYAHHGFVIYGTDPRCLRVGNDFHDEYLMVRFRP